MKKLLKAFATVAAIAMLGTGFVACSGGDDNGGSSGGGSTTVNEHLVKFNADGTYNAEGFSISKTGGTVVDGYTTGEAYMVLNHLINPSKDTVTLESDVTIIKTSGHNGIGVISVSGSTRKGYALLTGQNIKHTGCTNGGGGNGLSPSVTYTPGTTYHFKAVFAPNSESYYVYDTAGTLLGSNEGIAQSHDASDICYPAFGGTSACYNVYKNMKVVVNNTTYVIDGLDEMDKLASVNVGTSSVRMVLDADQTVTYSSLATGGTAAGVYLDYDSDYIDVTDDAAGNLTIHSKKVTSGTTITLTNKSNADLKATITVVVEDYAATDSYSTIADGLVYPAIGATSAYEDAELRVTFDSVPTLSSTGSVSIYKADGTFVDVILADDETITPTTTGNTIKVLNQMMRVEGNSLYIKVHPGKLAASTAYYVAIPKGVVTGTTFNGAEFTGFAKDKDVATWNFTTRAAHAAAATMTVSKDESSSSDFRSVQGALDAIGKSTEGDFVINVAAGTYHELVQFNGKANITIKGDSSYVRAGKTGADENTVITWANNNKWNPSMDTRATMFINGTGNVVLQNISVVNETRRGDERMAGTQEAQAEAVYFKSSGTAAVGNCSLKSYQDTICTRSSKAWFYDCYIEGDVDYNWGYSPVCLFENCNFKCLNDEARTTKQSILYVARVGTKSSTKIGKGYVFFNSTVEVEDGITIYFARSAGAGDFYDQGALVNVAITTNGSSSIEDTVSKPNEIAVLSGKEDKVGPKNYGVTVNGSALAMSDSIEATISDDDAAKEFNGRNAILNRVYDVTNDKYVNDSTIWKISSLETAFSATTDTSTIDEEVEASFEIGATYDYNFIADADAISYYTSKTDKEYTNGFLTWNTAVKNKWQGDTYGYNVGTGDYFKVSVTGSVDVTIYSSYGAASYTVTTTGSGTLSKTETTETTSDTVRYTAASEDEECTITFKSKGQNYCNGVKIVSIPVAPMNCDWNFIADTDAISYYSAKTDKEYSNGFLTWNTASKNTWQGDGYGYNVGTNDYFEVTVIGDTAVTIYSSYGAAAYTVSTTGTGTLDKSETSAETSETVTYTAASADEVCVIKFTSKGQNYCNRVSAMGLPVNGTTYDYNFIADATSIAYYTSKTDKEYSNGFLTWNTASKNKWQGDTYGYNVGTNDYFEVTVKGDSTVTIYSSYGAAAYTVSTTGTGTLDKTSTSAETSETVTYTAASADEVCVIKFTSTGQNYCNRVKIN